MAEVYLTQRDIDYISRVVNTEVPASLKQTDPAEYSRMVNAVVDTMVNRTASDAYPNTITGVANQSRQFSKITGPSSLDPYGSVQATPKASQALQSMVAGRIADLAQGADSEINGALSYANPNFSDASNLAEWVNPMIEAGAVKLGLGDMVHYHGLAPGQQAVDDVTVTAEGIPSGGIPVPYGPNDDPFANSLQAQALDGFSGLANPVSTREPAIMADLPTATEKQPGEWGVINGVGPAYYPTVNSWADIASAPPVDSMTASADPNAIPSLAAANENPMMSVPASATLGAPTSMEATANVPAITSPTQAISQADISRALFNPTGQGQMDPSFAAGLMGPNNPVVPSAVETTSYTAPQSVDIASSRFSTPAKTDRIGTSQSLSDMARMSPLAGIVDPATNTQSFMDQGPSPANIGGFPDAYASQRGPTSGILSADHQAVQGAAEIAFNRAMETQAARQAAANVNANGLVATTPGFAANAVANVPSSTVASNPVNPAMATPNFAQAMTPSIPSLNTFAASPVQTASTPAQQAIDAQMSQTATPQQQATGYQQAAQSMANAGMLNIGQQPPTDLSGNLPTSFDVLGTPKTQESITVANQPSVVDQTATIDGPVTTPAVEQQQNQTVATPTKTQAVTTPTTTQNKGLFNGMINKGTIGGGVIGSLAAGPLGGALGALLGGQLAKGGLTNPFGGLNSFSAPTTQIAGGVSNIGGLYGGLYSPGTYATASNGATITAQPGGYTTYENKYGVVESIGPDGKISSYFGGTPTAPTTTADPEAV